MEEISVNGEKYIKASVLAKNFGYTSDYIGQLCRSESVKATLVGRSWYVNEESLREHRQGRYRGTSAKSKEYLRQAIEQRQVKQPEKIQKLVDTHYENDERELFPSISKANSAISEVKLPENTPEIVVEATEEHEVEESEVKINTITVHRNPAPVFRTIPSTNPRPKSVEKSKNIPIYKPEKVNFSPKKSYVAVMAMALGFLIVEAAILFGTLGLEKRLVWTESNQAMVLYGYDLSDVFSSLQSLLVQ